MMKYLKFITYIYPFVILIFISGCQTPSNEILYENTPQHSPPTLKSSVSVTSTRSSFISTPISVTISPTSTPEKKLTEGGSQIYFEDVSDNEDLSNACHSSVDIDLNTNTNIHRITNLSFVDEHTIYIEGWALRDKESLLQFPSGQTSQESSESQDPSDHLLGDSLSQDVIYQTVLINLADNSVETLPVSSPSNNILVPCDNCLVESISKSPNQNWDLLQVSTGDQIGFWLSSHNKLLQLTDFTRQSIWEWANDESFLWFTASDVSFGAHSMIVSLDGQPQIKRLPSRIESPLALTYHLVAFSPEDLTFLSFVEKQNELFVIDAKTSFSKVFSKIDISKIGISKLQALTWDKSINQFLFRFEADKSIRIKNIDASINLEIAEQHIPSMLPFSVSPNFSVTSSGQHLAFGDSMGVIVFECD